MKKPSFRERFKYWFDNQMSKGNTSMIKLLLTATVIAIVIISAVILISLPSDERDIGGTVWDVFATVVNAWMPYSEEGNGIYIVFTAVAAIIGVLFTSVLIGIFSSAVEDKITTLREGTSKVLEKKHIVVLGFTPGEYTLIKQLIIAAGEKKTVILVASSTPKSEAEELIKENVVLPKNIKLICRCVDTSDVSALSICSIERSRVVIINHPDDNSTVKSIFAAHEILSKNGITDTKIISNVTDEGHRLPTHIAKKMNLICVQTDDFISRVIAHSCTELGISKTYYDLFDLAGGNIRLVKTEKSVGKTFGELVRTVNGIVPVGISDNGYIVLNPSADTVINDSMLVVCWKEEDRNISYAEDTFKNIVFSDIGKAPSSAAKTEKTVVFGINLSLDTIIEELPSGHSHKVIIVDDECFEPKKTGDESVSVCMFDGDINDKNVFAALLTDADHVVILSDKLDDEDADVNSLIKYIKVADFKRTNNCSYSITLELRREKNLQFVEDIDSETDLIVAPNLVSMFLAQLSDNPETVRVYKELLSNEGNEIHVKPISIAGDIDSVSVSELRARLLSCQMLLLGYIKAGKTVLNPDINDTVSLSDRDGLIVISQD